MSEVTGKDLIVMGFIPAPWFGEALRENEKRRLTLSQAARVRGDMSRFGLADVVDEIRPFGTIMAGDFEADAPWRRKKGAE